MDETASIVDRGPARGWRTGLVALALAGLGSGSGAAELTSALGSAFRPQAGAEAPAAGPAGPAGANLPGLRIVVSGASRSVASIDGQMVHVGDVVNGMRVTRIDPQGVVLIGEGGVSQRLTMSPSVAKRMVDARTTRKSNGVGQ